MSNVDKYIKLNFSFIKGEIIGLLCCTIFASVGIFMPTVAILVLVLLVAMIVLVVRVYSKIYSKTLFDEGAVLYQSLPFSSSEIVVAKTFVVTVATMITMVGLMGGLIVGLAVINLTVKEPELLTGTLDLIGAIGPAGAALMIFRLLTQSFFWASIFFASFAVFKTTKELADRLLMTAMFVAVLTFQSDYLSEFTTILIGTNIAAASIVEILVNALLGIGACLITKYYLDNKYIVK